MMELTARTEKTEKTEKINPHQLLYLVLTTDEEGKPEDHVIFMANRSTDVKEYIKNQIQKGSFTYCREWETVNRPVQKYQFESDWEEFRQNRKSLNPYLGGCYLDTCYAGYPYVYPLKRTANSLKMAKESVKRTHKPCTTARADANN